MATPHIQAECGEIADTVIMPGDPLRAKYVAEHYLSNAVLFNCVRGMLGYTGYYQNKRLSVMGSGMGIPSMGIYSYELFHFYNVNRILRMGTCGTSQPGIHYGDVVIAMGASTNSNFADQYQLSGTISAIADFSLLETAVSVARNMDIRFHVGNVLSGEAFYSPNRQGDKWAQMGILAGEMECYALYLNAAYLGKKALGIFTVSDENYDGGKKATYSERETSFTDMMQLALDTAIRLDR